MPITSHSLYKSLAKSEEKFRAIFEQSPLGIALIDSFTGQFYEINAKFCEIAGRTMDEMLNIDWMSITHPDDVQEDQDNMALLNANKIASFNMNKRYIRPGNSLVWINMTIVPLRVEDKANPCHLCMIEDITDRKKAEEETIYLSYHDVSTNLYNRRFYEEKIKIIDTENNLPISIVIGDVNGLKIANDAFGHDIGDKLLQKAAAAIRSVSRKDDIAVRWGGDEFVLLLPKTSGEEAEKIVERIKDICSNEHVGAINVSISFGGDTKNEAEEDLSKVFKNAEDCMYRNKVIENENINGNVIKSIVKTLYEKNPREEIHSKRVSELCMEIGKAMGLSEIETDNLRIVGQLHDIGKIAIEKNILEKPGKFTGQDWDQIKRHSEIGYRIISTSHDMSEIAYFVLTHHERWDGNGYPKGLKGESIPIVSRIVAIADSFDAMTSERTYKEVFSEEAALEEILENVGLQFDPEIARIFIEKVAGRQWN